MKKRTRKDRRKKREGLGEREQELTYGPALRVSEDPEDEKVEWERFPGGIGAGDKEYGDEHDAEGEADGPEVVLAQADEGGDQLEGRHEGEYDQKLEAHQPVHLSDEALADGGIVECKLRLCVVQAIFYVFRGLDHLELLLPPPPWQDQI